jgi:hypothetical protein
VSREDDGLRDPSDEGLLEQVRRDLGDVLAVARTVTALAGALKSRGLPLGGPLAFKALFAYRVATDLVLGLEGLAGGEVAAARQALEEMRVACGLPPADRDPASN